MHCPFNFIQWSITWQLDGADRFYNCFVAIISAGLKYHRRGPGKTSWENIRSSQSDNNRSIAQLPASVCYWSAQPCPALSLVHTTQLGLWLAELAGFVYSGPVLGSVWPSLARGVSLETVIGVTWTLWHLETCTELRHQHFTNSHQGELQIRGLEDEAGLCFWRGLLCDIGAWVGWMGWQFYKACKNILDIVFDVWIRRGGGINKARLLHSVAMSVAEIKIILVDIDIVHIGESSHMSSTCCLAKHTSLHPIGTQHIQLIPSYIDTTSIIILPPLVIRVGVLSFVSLWFSEIWPRFSHHNDDVNTAGPGPVSRLLSC